MIDRHRCFRSLPELRSSVDQPLCNPCKITVILIARPRALLTSSTKRKTTMKECSRSDETERLYLQ